MTIQNLNQEELIFQKFIAQVILTGKKKHPFYKLSFISAYIILSKHASQWNKYDVRASLIEK